MKYTKESLSKINGRFIGAHCYLTDYDVKLANDYVEGIEKSRSKERPKPGDVLRYTNKYGDYFDFAHIDKVDEDGNAYIAEHGGPSIHGFTNGGDPLMDTSGGAWEWVPTGKMKYVGTTQKRFWDFGHCGWCGDGGIDFYAEVNVWELSENKQPYSTKERDKYYISYRRRQDDYGYRYFASKDACYRRAWKSKEEFMSWAKMLKVEFTPWGDDTCWAWAYKEKDHHVSPMEFEALDLPEEIFTFNGKKRKCKREYDDENCTLITHFVWYWDDPTKDFYERTMEQNAAIEKYTVGW